MDRNTPRLSRRLVSLAKKPSTALSHEAEVGEGPAWMPRQPGANLGMLVCGVVVGDGRPGWVRSSACIWLFVSDQGTSGQAGSAPVSAAASLHYRP
jgi:hypothetical protein